MRKLVASSLALAGIVAGLCAVFSPTSEASSEQRVLASSITLEDMNASGLRPPGLEERHVPQSQGDGMYSVVGETTHSGSYVGMHTGKRVRAIITNNGACQSAIYSPQWLDIAFQDGEYGWIEHGVAHMCDGIYFYGFAAKNFDWSLATPTGTLRGGLWTYWTPVDAAEFDMNLNYLETYRDGDTGSGCNWWGQRVNGGWVRAAVNFGACGIGTQWHEGLESYRNWSTFNGSAALSTHNWGRVWNGVPGSGRTWSPGYWDWAEVDYQMHGMWWGYPYSDWHCAKQNVSIPVGTC